MRFRTFHLAAAGIAALLAACGGSTAPSIGKPAAIVASAGDHQSATVGTMLSAPIAVKVTDANGRGVPGASVDFLVMSGGGQLATASAVTNSAGVALDRWTLGTAAVAQSAQAQLVDPTTGALVGGVVFTATALPGPAARLAIVAGNGQTGYAGSALADSLVVVVADAYGNPLSGVTVTFAASGGGSVSPASATSGANGRAATSFTVGTYGTPQQVVASAAGTGSVTFTATSMQARQGTAVPLGDRPFGVAVSSGGVAYVTRLDGAVLTRFNAPATAIVTNVSVGQGPVDVKFDPSGTKAYVANQLSDNVGVVNVATNTQVATIPVTGDIFRVLLSPDATRLYVTTNANYVYAIDLSTNAVVGSYAVPAAANSLAISGDGSHLYVGTRSAGTVVELDTKTMTALRTWSPGGTVQEVVLSPDGTELYVVNEEGGFFSYDLTTGNANAQVNLGANSGAFGMALTPDGTKLYVTLVNTGQVTVLDRASKTVMQTYYVGGMPRRVAFASDGTALIANEQGWVTFLK